MPSKDASSELLAPPYTMEKRLFHAIHSEKGQSFIKEFNEAYAFCNSVRSSIGSKKWDLVIDVAGGHGALGVLFLILTSARTSVIIDPAQLDKSSSSVQRAWGQYYVGKEVRYRHECLRTGLPSEIDHAIKAGIEPSRILVVACHACQHLSEEIVNIAVNSSVHCAVAPCCQKDLSIGSTWKTTSKRLGIPIEKTMDILLAGKAMGWTNSNNNSNYDNDDEDIEAKVTPKVGNGMMPKYDVRMKVIDEKITPQNRIIICTNFAASSSPPNSTSLQHKRLQAAYKRAHTSMQNGSVDKTTATTANSNNINKNNAGTTMYPLGMIKFMSAFTFGFISAIVLIRTNKVRL